MRNSQTYLVQTDSRGRLLLPRELREHLGLEPKGAIAVQARTDGSIVLRDPSADRRHKLNQARGSFRGHGASVDELIAARRAEAKGELE